MAENTMQYLVSMTNRTREQLLEMEKEYKTNLSQLIADAVEYYYQSNLPLPERKNKDD